MKRSFVFCLLALSCTFTLGQYRARETVQENLEFTAGGHLSLSNVNGSITVSSWGRPEVQIIAVKKARAGSDAEAADLLAATEIVIDHSPARIDVRTELPERSRYRKHSVSVSYELMVPDRADLDLTSTNGNLNVEEVDGDIQLRTTNGKIRADALGGRVQASTTNGSIHAELLRFDQDEGMRFSTTNGSITLSVPAETRARVKASTTNGGISSDFPIRVEGRYHSKSLDAELNGGGPLIRLSTTNGSIRIRSGGVLQ